METKISKHQLEVMDILFDGGVIHVYRTGTELRAFISHRKGGVSSINIRISTVMALKAKGIIFRKKETSVYGDDWAGTWCYKKLVL